MDVGEDSRVVDDEPTEDILDDDGFKNQEDIRATMRADWESYYQHVASHIPYAACKMAPDVELNNDKPGVESTTKRKSTNTNGEVRQDQGG